jgi:DNA-binding CsgD family transcriptional regulator
MPTEYYTHWIGDDGILSAPDSSWSEQCGFGAAVPGIPASFAQTPRSHTEMSVSLTSRVRAVEAALDYSPCAVFLVNEHAVLQFANAAARRLLNDADGMMLCGRRLAACINGDAASLRELIAAAAKDHHTPERCAASRVMAVRRRSGKLPLSATAVRMSAEAPTPAAVGCNVLLFVADPALNNSVSAAHLRAVFGLTEREAAVALALLRAGSLPAAAAELGVALTTARSHLQHVFDKTATRSQVALAQMLSALATQPGAGRADGGTH